MGPTSTAGSAPPLAPPPPPADPCLNIFAAHPAVIAVASVDAYDGHSLFDASNASCIDVYAPAGGMGQGIPVAIPETNDTYISIYDG